MKTPVLFFLLLLHTLSYSQPVNQRDEKGKKDGRWLLYYDRYFNVVNDSSKAAYFFYTWYDHGARTHTHTSWDCKECKLEDSLAFVSQSGKLKMLDGKYTWYDKKGRLFSVMYFDKGEPVSWKQYYSSGELYLYFDYLKKVEDEPHSWFLYEYDKDGKMKASIPINKAGGWNIR